MARSNSSIEHCRVLFAQATQGQALEQIQVMFAAKDGRSVPTEGSVTSRKIDGRVIATHGFFRDITERLQAETLRARNEQLERERLAHYLEKMAALGKLAAGLAHELNNPAAAAQRSSDALLSSLRQRDAAAAELMTLGLSGDAWRTLAGFLPDRRAPSAAVTSDDPIAVSDREEALEDWLSARGIEEGWRLAASLAAGRLDSTARDVLARQTPPRWNRPSAGSVNRWPSSRQPTSSVEAPAG